MCKFNNRLFVFTLNCWLGLVGVWAKPLYDSQPNNADDLGTLVALSALMNSQDVHYDQRQKGEENYRIKLDGFFIGLPQEESTALLLLTDDVFENLAFGKNKPASATPQTSPPAPLTAPATSSTAAESNQVISSTAETAASNISPLVVEIPASKKYIEARHNVNSVSKTKSYISHFLNLIKRVRKH